MQPKLRLRPLSRACRRRVGDLKSLRTSICEKVWCSLLTVERFEYRSEHFISVNCGGTVAEVVHGEG
eukprot:24452-Eustigmatos_ZCMA.PRE.1